MRTIGTRIALLLVVAGIAAPAAAARVLSTNHVGRALIAEVTDGVRHCQRQERLPRGTRALRLAIRPLDASGPRIGVTALRDDDERPIDGGVRAAGWSGDSVTVPLRAPVRRTRTVTLCMTVAREQNVGMFGLNAEEPAPTPQLGGPRVQVAYLDRTTDADGADAPGGLLGVLVALLRLLAG